MKPRQVLEFSEDNTRLALIAFAQANGLDVPYHAALTVNQRVSQMTGRSVYSPCLSWEQIAPEPATSGENISDATIGEMTLEDLVNRAKL